MLFDPCIKKKKMSSSEGEDFLNSADVNEEFSFDEQEEYEKEMEEDEIEEDAEDSDERQKYSEELEYEDIGEPATFNFNIHNGTIK